MIKSILNHVKKRIFLTWLLCVFLLNVGNSQNKGIDFKAYMSKPSIERVDNEFEYITSSVSPLFHLRVGVDVFANKEWFVTLHLGTVLGNERYIKPSTFEGFFSNTPEDSIYRKKAKNFSFISLGAELKKYFHDNDKGIYLSVEPQFSFLISTNENLLIRHNNVVVMDRSRELADELNNRVTHLERRI